MGNWGICFGDASTDPYHHQQLISTLHPGPGAYRHSIWYRDNEDQKSVHWGYLAVVDNHNDNTLQFHLEDTAHRPLFATNLIASWSQNVMVLCHRDRNWAVEMTLVLGSGTEVIGELMLRRSHTLGYPFAIWLALR